MHSLMMEVQPNVRSRYCTPERISRRRVRLWFFCTSFAGHRWGFERTLMRYYEMPLTNHSKTERQACYSTGLFYFRAFTCFKSGKLLVCPVNRGQEKHLFHSFPEARNPDTGYRSHAASPEDVWGMKRSAHSRFCQLQSVRQAYRILLIVKNPRRRTTTTIIVRGEGSEFKLKF